MPETGKFEETNHASFGKSPSRGTRERVEDLRMETDLFPNLSLDTLKQDNIERFLLRTLGEFIRNQDTQSVTTSSTLTPLPAGLPK